MNLINQDLISYFNDLSLYLENSPRLSGALVGGAIGGGIGLVNYTLFGDVRKIPKAILIAAVAGVILVAFGESSLNGALIAIAAGSVVALMVENLAESITRVVSTAALAALCTFSIQAYFYHQ